MEFFLGRANTMMLRKLLYRAKIAVSFTAYDQHVFGYNLKI